MRSGEEFREDLRSPGSRNAQARRLLSPEELAPLTRLSSLRSLLAIAQTTVLQPIPAVPHYHLPQLHRPLVDKGPLQHAEVRDIACTWQLIFAPRRSRA